MHEEKTPKVSVCVVTYNQEKYIRQCLQSIVDQETDFDFEVIVGDDCSTDGTRAILQEFAYKYPGVVKPIFQEKNIGPAQNYFSVHKLAKGEYVAHVDGDDYWLPNKLLYQVNILNNNRDIIFVADYIGKSKNLDIRYKKLNAEELFKANNIALHSSKLYRKEYAINAYEDREYMDFEINLRQLGINGYCALTKKTTFYRVNSDTSIRRSVNVNLIDCCIKVCDFMNSIGVKKEDVEIVYNQNIKSFIKLGVVTNDSYGINNIKIITNNCSYRLQIATKLYLSLSLYRFGMNIFRFSLVTKRKVLSLLSKKIVPTSDIF
jgi:glycosyltransferase involved in cell wall biosynthesis